MSNSSTILRQIFNDARPLVETALDLSEQFKGFRELATANGLDWSQIKALLKAQIQDEREDDGKDRVGRIIEKADFATAYADMLGLGAAKMNENNFSPAFAARVAVAEERRKRLEAEADLPPHDEDGVIIEPATIFVAAGEAGARTSSCPQAGLTVSPPLSQPATAPPKAVAAAPVERSPFPDNAPGAPIPGEMPDIPAFLRRTA